MPQKDFLVEHYINKGMAASAIAREYGCSENKINYWLQKYKIKKRSISEAVYLKHNPFGDPFTFSHPKTRDDYFLYGLGLGIFWGEGNKVNTQSIRLGNTDPNLIRYFLKFLKNVYKIDQSRLRFGLQLFNDIPKKEALNFWTKELNVSKKQFYKITVSPSMHKGTYRKKSEFGVLTIYFSNTKLRDMIVGTIEELCLQSKN